MRKVLVVLLVYSILMTLLVFTPFAANANETDIAATGESLASGTTGDCTWKIEGTKLTISGNGKMNDYRYTYKNDYYVTTAPWGSYSFSTVVIEIGVTTIGRSAFYGCKELTSIVIPDSVTSIGDNAFYDTAWYDNQPDGLVYAGKAAYKVKGDCPFEIVIKDGTLVIADSAFINCPELENINISNSVTSIGDYAFSNCTGLTSIDIPDSVTSIGDGTFSGCTGLTNIVIPDSITSIGDGTFSNCTGLTTINIPDSVTSIGEFAFYGCKELTSIVIPDSVTSIGDYAFGGNTSLSTLTLSQYATDHFASIFGYQWYDLNSIRKITLSDNVTSIDELEFYGCKNLTSITIPSSVTDIGSKAFGYYQDLDTYALVRIKDFTVYGYKGTEAEKYANNNRFAFIDLNNQPTEPTVAPTQEPTQESTTEPEAKPIKGDIDGDGEITIVDTTYMQRYLAGLQTPDFGIGEPIE